MKHGDHSRVTGSSAPSLQSKFRCSRHRARLRLGLPNNEVAPRVLGNKGRVVNNMHWPYTNVNIVTAGGNQITMPRSFASGTELLLMVAQSMIDPACVIRLCADGYVLNNALLHNEAWVINKINCNVITVVVSKANSESGTIEAFRTVDLDDFGTASEHLGSYRREFKKIGQLYDPDYKLPKMPWFLHTVLENVKPGEPVTRCWGVNFPSQAMDLATCEQCASCTTCFGALLNNWCTDHDGSFKCNECINNEARVIAVCSRCECSIRNDDAHVNVRPQIATKPDFFIPDKEIVNYTELWCASCSVNYSNNCVVAPWEHVLRVLFGEDTP